MKKDHTNRLIEVINSKKAIAVIVIILFGVVVSVFIISPSAWKSYFQKEDKIVSRPSSPPVSDMWHAPDSSTIISERNAEEIKYGRNLIAHTSEYLGPKGKVMHISNGMNCQNCHLNAGTKVFGNNYSAVASTYPKFRARSGTEETIEKRVNDCIERSLNGQALSNDSREMKAIVAYIKWVGKDVTRGVSPKGVGLVEPAYLELPADPAKGKIIYQSKCTVCHGKSGDGLMNINGTAWLYPPLWGKNSYNIGAGLYRLSRFAGYIKANMPLGATYDKPILTDEESWHVAAYVNSLDRPQKDLQKDWPDISKKPVDHPFGPFTDGFDEQQHKYGPFTVIQEKRKQLSAAKK